MMSWSRFDDILNSLRVAPWIASGGSRGGGKGFRAHRVYYIALGKHVEEQVTMWCKHDTESGRKNEVQLDRG